MALTNIYLYSNYNNYYNRLVKFGEELADYPDYTHALASTNFNPNDGANTEHIFNYDTELEGVDYAVVTDLYNDIVSRWFVIEAVRTRNGQVKLTLRRDVVSDYYNIIIQSPMFIEKATLKNSSPLIFNSERMTYNQIKKSQTPIYDASGDSYCVLYVDNKFYENMQGDYEDVNIKINPNVVTNLIKSSIEQDYKVSQNPFISGVAYVTLQKRTTATADHYYRFGNDGSFYSYGRQTTSYWNCTDLDVDLMTEKVTEFNFGNLFAQANNAIGLNGKYCKSGNTVYRINVRTETVTETTTQNPSTALGLAISPAVTGFQNDFEVKFVGVRQYITFEVVESVDATVKFFKANRRCKDAPYRIIYARNKTFAVGSSSTNTLRWSMMDVFTDLAVKLGASCYDAQILPYCPDEQYRITYAQEAPFPKIGSPEYDIRFQFTLNQQTFTGAPIHVAESASFKLFIPYTLEVPSDPVEFKVANECDMHRICSPNGSGGFDFSLAKNRGLKGFNVECTYKPVNPYINVCPQFGGLYGQSFQDYRGLICQGDFSLPLINDQWVAYEQNNKNYLNIFRREMDSLDLSQEYQRKQLDMLYKEGIGSMSGAISGAVMGNFVGGPIGAAVGGLTGLATSFSYGMQDYKYQTAILDDAKNLKDDLFGFSLGNIQARPTTLAKTGCITIDNLYVPYLEYYTCTDEEKQALRDKIKYNGMSVGVIGKIEDYLQEDYSYVKGQLIRCEGISDDFHIVNEIGSELSKGVYIK